METKFIHHTKQDPWRNDTINWKGNFDALKGVRADTSARKKKTQSMKAEHDRLYAEGYKAAMLDMLFLDGQDQQSQDQGQAPYDPYGDAQQVLQGPAPDNPYTQLLGQG